MSARTAMSLERNLILAKVAVSLEVTLPTSITKGGPEYRNLGVSIRGEYPEGHPSQAMGYPCSHDAPP